jgi:hypothetical protein
MSRCLRDETLWRLYEGEGTEAERSHLKECAACTKRYQQLAADLQVIGRVLQEPPPLHASSRSRRLLRVRWVPVAAALAVVAAFVWGGVWLREPSRPGASGEMRDEEVVRLLNEELSLALFATANLNLGAVPARATDSAYLQAALDGGWPCEPQKQSRSADCETDPLSLLLEEEGR